ncbi:MAG: E3 binding domain-containing protein, partial [Rhizobiales bacterium]|nr:E3 binding domain-containing protein [Hyphomicrobiales bacterium]
MATEIKVPTLGESVAEATVGQWFKKEGDVVARDEPLVELETDKVTIEVPAPAAGRLESISVKDGETVGVGALLGMLAEGAGAQAAPKNGGGKEAASKPAARKADAKTAAEAPQAKSPAKTAAEPPQAQSPDESPAPGYEMPPAPSARKLMEEKSVAPAEVWGTGKRGQVLKGDVVEFLGRGTAPPAAAPTAARAPSAAGDEAREERVHMTRLRQTIARRLKEAQNQAAMLTTFNDVDMSAVMELR